MSESTDHPTRVMTLDEYRKAREADRASMSATPNGGAAPVDPDEQAGYRAFSPDYYAGIQAGMNRMRSGYASMPAAAVAAPAGAPTEAAAAAAPHAAAQPEMIGAVPVDELMDHNYDGIQEYDNPTPGWWYAVFFATVLFSGLYILVYHLAVPSLSVRHATAEARHLDQQFAELNQLENGEPKILAIMNEESWLARGGAIFTSACAQCHSADGSGLIGPNLTDETYKNISGLMDIADLVVTGTANGSMPSQKNILNENEIALVAAYVASLRGQNLPTNPMVSPEYEGQPIDPWPTLNAAGQVVPAQGADETPAGEEVSRAGD